MHLDACESLIPHQLKPVIYQLNAYDKNMKSDRFWRINNESARQIALTEYTFNLRLPQRYGS